MNEVVVPVDTASRLSAGPAESTSCDFRRATCCTQSGRRGSNPRHSAWKADALPTELLPRKSRSPSSGPEWWGKDSNLRRREPADLQSAPVGHLGTPPQFALAKSSPSPLHQALRR